MKGEKSYKAGTKPKKIKGLNPNVGGKREGSGRKKHAPTDKDREQVETLSGYGVPYEQISSLVAGGIDVNTLQKYYQAELIRGKAKANGEVGKTLFQKAVGGDTAAAVWWSKSQMRWRGESVDHTSSDGTMTPKAGIDASRLSTAALAEVLRLMDDGA